MLTKEHKEKKGKDKFEEVVQKRTEKQIKTINKILNFLEEAYLVLQEKSKGVGMKEMITNNGIDALYSSLAQKQGLMKREGNRASSTWTWTKDGEPNFDDAALLYDTFSGIVSVRNKSAKPEEKNNGDKFNHVDEMSEQADYTPEEKLEKVMTLLNWLYQTLMARPLPAKELGLLEKLTELKLSKLISTALFKEASEEEGLMNPVLSKFTEHEMIKKISWAWGDIPSYGLGERSTSQHSS